MAKAVVFFFACFLFVCVTVCLDNGLVRTPPMGWLVWERYRCQINCTAYPDSCIDENLFITMADLMASQGFRDAGYNLVNIDDCWPAMERDSSGRLQADPVRFPHGIKWLSDYMHQRGLKLGIYEDFGTKTCGGYPGSEFHLKTDADTFASWGVDMLKLDGCNSPTSAMKVGYPEMRQYLNETGRPIVYSCSWPAYLEFSTVPWASVQENCNLWRLYHDIQDSWESVSSIIQFWIKNQDILAPLSVPGAWNDPDQLLIGDFSLSIDESKSQMAIWSIWAAPLFMSVDLRTLTNEQKAILLNKEIIAVNQDSLGIQGKAVKSFGASQSYVLTKPLADGSVAVVFHYYGSAGTPEIIGATLADLGVKSGAVHVRDLFEHKDLGRFAGSFETLVNPHGVVMVKMTPTP